MIWKSLWRLPIPHKARHFAWRACREALPTKVNLRRRKVLIDDSCEWCKEKPETAGHALWSCPRAQEVWECSKLVLSLDRSDEHSSTMVQKMNWSPPPPGLCKVNVDAATFNDIRSTGAGIVIRDSMGQVVAALCRKLEAPFSPLEAESKAFEAGILFALSCGFTGVGLEGDSQVRYTIDATAQCTPQSSLPSSF
ncbi:hypothetical protein SO802_022103 [Lithocarpus litseifolius]|uniref:Reverse transcriptase zinc-binding domain-containing protein n=1 Tax=Lithocarpus litseifolius TaxID=425828 RepID=A0AAW2CIN9_9ROSI